MSIEPILRQGFESPISRFEGKLDHVLDRLTRTEERQKVHSIKLDNHEAMYADHTQRLRDLELRHALSAANADHIGKRMMGRWAAVGATLLMIVGSMGSTLGSVLITVIQEGI